MSRETYDTICYYNSCITKDTSSTSREEDTKLIKSATKVNQCFRLKSVLTV